MNPQNLNFQDYTSKNACEIRDYIFTNLTIQELKILKLASQEYSNKEIADILSIAESTVKKHRENISKKFSLHGKVAFRKFLRLCSPLF